MNFKPHPIYKGMEKGRRYQKDIVRLEAPLLRFILYVPFANAANLVFQATRMTNNWIDDCQNGCEQ